MKYCGFTSDRGGVCCLLRAALALSVLAWCGCGDDDDEEPTTLRSGASGDAGDVDAGTAVDADTAVCPEEADGEPCGSGKYCVKGRCAFNICGDGVQAGSESCDDGNQRTGDGCDPACRTEGEGCGNAVLEADEECDDGNWIDDDACTNACLIIACGNGRIDDREECDDGNTIDDDGCSNTCFVVQCRNGRLDPGEECDDGNAVNRDQCTNACTSVTCGNGHVEGWEFCDDGNTVDDDACPNDCLEGAICGNDIVEASEQCEGPHQAFPASGDRNNPMCGLPGTVTPNEDQSWSCSADCKSRLAYDDCEACRDEWCRNVLGVDVVKGCFEEVIPDFGLGMADECALQQCADAVNCALANRCTLDPTREEVTCYCGEALDNVACQSAAQPGADAKCVAEWQNAARSTDNALVFGRFADLAYPTGWAHYLLQCYSSHCEHECMDTPTCGSNADCGSGEVCCATGTTDDARYHNFKCVTAAMCQEGVVTAGSDQVRMRVACKQNSDCPDAHPYCKDKRDAASEATAPLVAVAGKMVCDTSP